jgi:hypothetical protein
MLTCTVESCDKKHFGIGYCKMHYERFKRNGHTDKVRMVHPKKCTVEDCNNEFKGQGRSGLCREHYLLNTKDKKYTKETKHGRPKNESKCKVENCVKNYYCLGYCRAHYLKFKKYDDPLKIIHKTTHGESCAFLGCLEPYYLNDYCQKHYWRNQRYGSPYILNRNTEHSGKCSIEDCKNEHYAKELCKNHYMMYEYGMSSNYIDIELANAMNNTRKKYKNTCQWYKCGKSLKNNHVTIHVHHIFPRSEYPELKYEERYMICYCKFHHVYWHEKRYEKLGRKVDMYAVNFLKEKIYI